MSVPPYQYVVMDIELYGDNRSHGYLPGPPGNLNLNDVTTTCPRQGSNSGLPRLESQIVPLLP